MVGVGIKPGSVCGEKGGVSGYLFRITNPTSLFRDRVKISRPYSRLLENNENAAALSRPHLRFRISVRVLFVCRAVLVDQDSGIGEKRGTLFKSLSVPKGPAINFGHFPRLNQDRYRIGGSAYWNLTRLRYRLPSPPVIHVVLCRGGSDYRYR